MNSPCLQPFPPWPLCVHGLSWMLTQETPRLCHYHGSRWCPLGSYSNCASLTLTTLASAAMAANYTGDLQRRPWKHQQTLWSMTTKALTSYPKLPSTHSLHSEHSYISPCLQDQEKYTFCLTYWRKHRKSNKIRRHRNTLETKEHDRKRTKWNS